MGMHIYVCIYIYIKLIYYLYCYWYINAYASILTMYINFLFSFTDEGFFTSWNSIIKQKLFQFIWFWIYCCLFSYFNTQYYLKTLSLYISMVYFSIYCFALGSASFSSISSNISSYHILTISLPFQNICSFWMLKVLIPTTMGDEKYIKFHMLNHNVQIPSNLEVYFFSLISCSWQG